MGEAGNLMGIRRASQTLASILGLRLWLCDDPTKINEKSHQRSIRGNTFAAFQNSESEEVESEEECIIDSEQVEDSRSAPKLPATKQNGKTRKAGTRRGSKHTTRRR